MQNKVLAVYQCFSGILMILIMLHKNVGYPGDDKVPDPKTSYKRGSRSK